jgi:hypothetical protein
MILRPGSGSISTAATAPASRPLNGGPRILRVAALGGSSLALACGAHLVAGGQLPTAEVLGLTAAMLGLVSVTVTARRVGYRTLLLVLGVEQLVLHYLLTAAAGVQAASCQPGTGSVGHDAALMAHSSCFMAGSGADQMSMPGWSMSVTHLVATLLTAWLLSRGESWLWELANRIVRSATATPTATVRTMDRRPSTPPSESLNSPPPASAAPRGPPVPTVSF